MKTDIDDYTVSLSFKKITARILDMTTSAFSTAFGFPHQNFPALDLLKYLWTYPALLKVDCRLSF